MPTKRKTREELKAKDKAFRDAQKKRKAESKNKTRYEKGKRAGTITSSYSDYQKSQEEYKKTHGRQDRKVKVGTAPKRSDYDSRAKFLSDKRQFDAGTLTSTVAPQNIGTGKIEGTYAGSAAQITRTSVGPSLKPEEKKEEDKKVLEEVKATKEKEVGIDYTSPTSIRAIEPDIEAITTEIATEKATAQETEDALLDAELGIEEIPTAEELRAEYEETASFKEGEEQERLQLEAWEIDKARYEQRISTQERGAERRQRNLEGIISHSPVNLAMRKRGVVALQEMYDANNISLLDVMNSENQLKLGLDSKERVNFDNFVANAQNAVIASNKAIYDRSMTEYKYSQEQKWKQLNFAKDMPDVFDIGVINGEIQATMKPRVEIEANKIAQQFGQSMDYIQKAKDTFGEGPLGSAVIATELSKYGIEATQDMIFPPDKKTLNDQLDMITKFSNLPPEALTKIAMGGQIMGVEMDEQERATVLSLAWSMEDASKRESDEEWNDWLRKENFKAGMKPDNIETITRDDGSIWSVNHATGKKTEIFGANSVFGVNNEAQSNVQNISKLSENSSVSATVNQNGVFEFGNATDRVNGDECGGYVNDTTGQYGMMGDTFASKIKNVPKDESSATGYNMNPVSGGYFVSEIGQYGHTGMVRAVDDNGIYITDYNWIKDANGNPQTRGLRRDAYIEKGSEEWNMIKGFGAVGFTDIAQTKREELLGGVRDIFGKKEFEVEAPQTFAEKAESQLLDTLIKSAKGDKDEMRKNLKDMGVDIGTPDYQKAMIAFDSQADELAPAYNQLDSQQKIETDVLAVDLIGTIAARNPANKEHIAKLKLEGKTNDEIEDSLRRAGYGTEFTGRIKQTYNQLTLKDFSVEQVAQNRERLESSIESYGVNSPETKELILGIAREKSDATMGNKLFGKIQSTNTLIDIEDLIREYENAGGDTGLLTGKTEEYKSNIFGETGDEKLAEIANRIGLAIVDYRSAVSGAAFTESEAKAYERLFPSTSSASDLNIQKIKSLKDAFGNYSNSYYKQQMGTANFNELFPDGAMPYLIGEDYTIKSLMQEIDEAVKRNAPQSEIRAIQNQVANIKGTLTDSQDIKVIRKSDGVEGTIPANEFDSNLYQKI